MAAYRAVRILQLLSENTGEDKALLSDELVELLAHPDDPARMPISAARRSIYTSISADVYKRQAQGWDTSAGASRLPVHITGKEERGKKVDAVRLSLIHI